MVPVGTQVEIRPERCFFEDRPGIAAIAAAQSRDTIGLFRRFDA